MLSLSTNHKRVEGFSNPAAAVEERRIRAEAIP
jgi:hypothetical protein